MNTIKKRRTIRMLSREATVHRALGKNRRVTTGQSREAFAPFLGVTASGASVAPSHRMMPVAN